MSIYLLLAFTALAFSQLDLFGSDDDDEAAQEPTLEENEVVGTEGADTITEETLDNFRETLQDDPDRSNSIRSISGAGGDDLIEIDSFVGNIDGGDGDDTVTNFDDYGYIHGGAGDDVLTGHNPYEVNGGDGNDVLNIDRQGGEVDSSSVGDGGAGDDEINYFGQFEYDTRVHGGARLTGGEGSDQFNVTFIGPSPDSTAPDSDNWYGDPDDWQSASYLSITDFDADEDSLTLDLTGIGPGTEVTDVELRHEDGTDVYEIYVHLRNDTGLEWERGFSVVGNVDDTLLDEISILLPQ